MIFNRSWLMRKEVKEFKRIAPYALHYIPRLKALSDLYYQPIPTSGHTPTLLEESLRHAREIHSKNASLYVPLSGGADSSLVAASLAKVGARPVIGLSETGKETAEHVFIEWLQSQGCTIEICEQDSIKNAVSRGMHVVTGTHGDNLFLGDTVFAHEGLADDVWHMSPNDVLQVLSGRKGDLWGTYKHLFDEMPEYMPRTAANVLWWTNFAGHWSCDCYYLTLDINIGAPGVTHTHFFGSDGFQLYMMQDAALRCGKSYDTIKEQSIATVSKLVGRELSIPSKTGGFGDIRPQKQTNLFKITKDWTVIGETQ